MIKPTENVEIIKLFFFFYCFVSTVKLCVNFLKLTGELSNVYPRYFLNHWKDVYSSASGMRS